MNLFKKLLRRLDTEFNYAFFRRYRYARTVRRHLAKRYTADAPPARNERKMVVYMADGIRRHGGIADRLRGMVTLYEYCRDNGLDFRINFTSPFNLERYLVPNAYDWRLRRGELSMNSATSRPFYMDTRDDTGPREDRFQRKIMRHYFSRTFKQAHVYTIFYCGEHRFAELFGELFRPAEAVAREVEKAKAALGEGYISVSTRFLELLGDFKEPRRERETLPEPEQEALIAKCIAQIERLHQQHGVNILVTSDSGKFLERARELPYCHVIDGEVAHIDVAGDNRDAADLKTFVDFFAIAGASRSFLLVSGGMYRSNFSKRAAQATGHEFTILRF